MLFSRSKRSMPAADEALPGRATRPFPVPERHAVLDAPLEGPFRPGLEVAILGMGCFWGAERIFWRLDGVESTAVGYAGGTTPNPTYDEVCSGGTGHTEAVQAVFDPAKVSYRDLLKVFWESHDPTQGYRQGNDVGTQYRSAVYYTSNAQRAEVEASRAAYSEQLRRSRYGDITTEIAPAGTFWYAEDYHQQYLHKVPWGYCGIGGTGVSCPMPSAAAEQGAPRS